MNMFYWLLLIPFFLLLFLLLEHNRKAQQQYVRKKRITDNLSVFDYDGDITIIIELQSGKKVKMDIRDFQLHVLLVRTRLVPNHDMLDTEEMYVQDSEFVRQKMNSYHVEYRSPLAKDKTLYEIFETDNKKYIVIYLRFINAKKYKIDVQDKDAEIYYTTGNVFADFDRFDKTTNFIEHDALLPHVK